MYFMSIMDIVEVWNMQSNTQQQTTFQLKNAGFFKVADNAYGYDQWRITRINLSKYDTE